MCLADKVAYRAAEVLVERQNQTWRLPDSSAFAERLQGTDVRYVLQGDVIDACRTVSGEWADLLDPSNSRLRAPLPLFWVEWTDSETGEEVGVLVDAASDGRSGNLRVFWNGASGAEVAQGVVIFDLDRTIDQFPRGDRPAFPLKVLPQELAALRPHLAVVIDECWESYFRSTSLGADGLQRAAAACGENLWPDIIQALAFCALLGARVPLTERPVDRARLNKARTKAGKPRLFDHVELTIGKPQLASSGDGGMPGGGRRHPRLHSVRGHLVRRRDQIFWRTAHMRGLENMRLPAPATRIVRMHTD